MSKFDPFAIQPALVAAGVLVGAALAVWGSPYIAFAVLVIR